MRGYNGTGKVGDGTAIDQGTFVKELGISNAVALESGTDFTVALRAYGLVYGGGNITWGQLCDKSSSHRSTFIRALRVSKVVAFAAGLNFTVALRADGIVFASARDANGQFGMNNTGESRTLIQITAGIADTIRIGAG